MKKNGKYDNISGKFGFLHKHISLEFSKNSSGRLILRFTAAARGAPRHDQRKVVWGVYETRSKHLPRLYTYTCTTVPLYREVEFPERVRTTGGMLLTTPNGHVYVVVS